MADLVLRVAEYLNGELQMLSRSVVGAQIGLDDAELGQCAGRAQAG